MKPQTLGSRLREAMERKELSPAALARDAGTSGATISNWLNDLVRPEHVKAAQLYQIADAAGINDRELLLGDAGAPVAHSSHPVKSEVLTLALQLVYEALESRSLILPPAKQAEAVQIAFDLLEEGMPRAKVLRFVLAAVG